MRLTLRTLLAYLDNTLDPNDAEALRQKLSESAFATQLVQRIRSTLVDPTLSAPSPDAVSPVDEANVISEYLDSTLSAEQIAEVEKACLESDSHLAEAAACHQILTMQAGGC
jgi:anti-sigma factor RsiW